MNIHPLFSIALLVLFIGLAHGMQKVQKELLGALNTILECEKNANDCVKSNGLAQLPYGKLSGVTSVCTNEAKSAFFTGSRDGIIRVWQPGVEWLQNSLKSLTPNYLNLLPQEIVQEIIRFGLISTSSVCYECKALLRGHCAEIVEIYLDQKNDILFSCDTHGFVKIWGKSDPRDSRSYVCIATLHACIKEIDFIRPLRFFMDNDQLYMLGVTKTGYRITLWKKTEPNDPSTYKWTGRWDDIELGMFPGISGFESDRNWADLQERVPVKKMAWVP